MGARAAVVACVTMALTPAVASAARPAAVTGAPTEMTSTSVTLTGTVTPNGSTTDYAFVYGTTRYTAHTALVSVGGFTPPISPMATEKVTPTMNE